MTTPHAADGPVDARLVDEAAQWLARMHAGHFTEADAQRCERWRNQSPDHQRVWQSAEQLSRKFGAVPPAVGMPVLDRGRATANRRALLRTVAVLLAAPSVAWIGYRAVPWQTLGAEYRTATGERRDIVLDDGSRISINTATAIDVAFDATRRLVRQREGEILIETASDPSPGPHRPFLVETPEGRLQALGTRFIVRRDEGHSRLTVLAGAVEVRPSRAPDASVVVSAGQQLAFTADAVGAVSPASTGADAWAQGVLYAQEMRLGDFIAELARYRSGVLRCDPAIADLRVSGAFQLDNTDRILDILAQTLPVRVDSRTRYWVTLTAA
ncbi:FecR domain-containing protein [Variovorax sp. KBW07]|uniref:FecR domain-containing protein n=1 Tax=Variovorax sp. KBW07 TaxID=2153358 RepID=UPI0021AA8BA1|nr:FecR domain-containing protein [Variovorax sp. KBW07]